MTLVQPLAVFADTMTSSNAFVVNPDYLIGSASNADPYGIATMELSDEDYYIQPFSSIKSVTNTIDYQYAKFWIQQIDVNTEVSETFSFSLSSDGFARYSVPEGKAVIAAGLRLLPGALPRSGDYRFELSFSSDLSQSYSSFRFWSKRSIANASPLEDYTIATSYTQQLSGDVYCDAVVSINALDHFTYFWSYSNSVPAGSLVAGYFDVNFTSSSDQPDYSTVGTGMGQQDYEADVSGSLSDISSSIGDMSESLDSAAENLEYISTSQNLIIQGIDNVIMHISDQLYAFWDQLYNLIHEPTYARLGDILSAIRNLDLQITVEMTEVTNAVNKMNQDMQNKLQQTTDKITGGYDSSVLESENQQIQSAVDDYDQSEQAILDSVEGNIEDFTYPSFDDLPLGTLGALGFFGGLMQSIFEGMGAFNMIITFSLTLVFVLILIGYHRIRN